MTSYSHWGMFRPYKFSIAYGFATGRIYKAYDDASDSVVYMLDNNSDADTTYSDWAVHK